MGHVVDGEEPRQHESLLKAMRTDVCDSNASSKDEHEVHVEGTGLGDVVSGWPHFEDVQFASKLVDELRAAGFKQPSPVQRYAWPVARCRRDILALAETGSGKTLAFLLPVFDRLLSEKRQASVDVSAVILTPTRELAEQIVTAATRFGSSSRMRTLGIYGGAPHWKQLQPLRTQPPQCLVCCPGRLIDFLERGQICLDRVLALVVDEADRLLDMGFEPQVRQIMSWMPGDRHSMCFSATWPEEIRKLAGFLLREDYVTVRIGRNVDPVANSSVQQIIEIYPDVPAKEQALLELLMSQPQEWGLFSKAPPKNMNGELGGSVLIFCTTRNSVDRLHPLLEDWGVLCASTHSLLDQNDREQALADFRKGGVPVLVSTDLVARGLDISTVKLVINFEPPHSAQPEDYVHRIGRTGRAGRQGTSVTYLMPLEANQAAAIVEVLHRAGLAPSEEVAELASRARGTGKMRRQAQRMEYLNTQRIEHPSKRHTDETQAARQCHKAKTSSFTKLFNLICCKRKPS